jgi:hypothetical protein
MGIELGTVTHRLGIFEDFEVALIRTLQLYKEIRIVSDFYENKIHKSRTIINQENE